MIQTGTPVKLVRPVLSPTEKYPQLSRPLATGPQWGFLGASVVEVVPVSPVALSEVMALIGLTISPGDTTFKSFEWMRARFLRRLRQDEFGPTNADCSAALRHLLKSYDRIIKRLDALDPPSRHRLSEVLSNVWAVTAERISSLSVVQTIECAASGLGRKCAKIEKGIKRKQFEQLAKLAGKLFFDLNALDSRSQSEVELAATRVDLRIKIPPLRYNDTCGIYLRRLTLFRDQIARTIKSLGCGPEKPLSLHIAVSQLADFYQKVTGRPVTSNGYKGLNNYTGRPQSEAGIFIFRAMQLLMPPAEWFAKKTGDYPKEMLVQAPHRTNIFVNQKTLEQAVHQALQEFVHFQNATRKKSG